MSSCSYFFLLAFRTMPSVPPSARFGNALSTSTFTPTPESLPTLSLTPIRFIRVVRSGPFITAATSLRRSSARRVVPRRVGRSGEPSSLYSSNCRHCRWLCTGITNSNSRAAAFRPSARSSRRNCVVTAAGGRADWRRSVGAGWLALALALGLVGLLLLFFCARSFRLHVARERMFLSPRLFHASSETVVCLLAVRRRFQMSASAMPNVSTDGSDPLKPERPSRSTAGDDADDAHSTTSADSGNGSLNNVSSLN